MKFAAVTIALCVTLGTAVTTPRAVGLDITRRTIDDDIPTKDGARIRKRQSTVEQTLDNLDTLYFANLTLGTPPQDIQLHVDTGSSDLWVNVPQSSLCRSTVYPCKGGTYDTTASSSYDFVNSEFNISYVDGSGALGDYVTDTLGFGGVTLRDFQFGIGRTSSSQQGVLGIGYAINEVQVNRAELDPYPNLPVALKNNGHIKSTAYSLWLNDLDASTGTILFGGVDTAQYEGDLATVPILLTYGTYSTLSIALTGFAFNGNDIKSSSLPAGVLLDSGSTLSYLPSDIVTQIYDQIRAVYVDSVGAAYAPCSLASSSSSLDFVFSGKQISVPFNELLLDGQTTSGRPLSFDNGEKACLFGIAPSPGGGIFVLGDTFLRSGYIVYDLENNEISLAQTRFNATGHDVREIGTGTSPVPGATPVPNPVTNVAGATNGGLLGGVSATVSGGLGSPTGQAESSGVSNAASATFAAVVAIAVAIIL